ncbi:MAG TPA: hypothetical protein PKI61_01790, partial [bacterium]|nr:hypothetical protein [bacterium]
MKKLISIALLVVFSTAAFSQINDVKLDSNLTINKIYVGILNTTAFNTEAATVTNNFSFRVGTMATWQTTKWMKVKAFATLDYSDGTATPINSFSVKFHNKKEGFGVELGYMATPATESRPLPPSAAGHFETFTEANIPGSALGIKTGVKIGKTTTLSAGVCARNKEAEYHLRFG